MDFLRSSHSLTESGDASLDDAFKPSMFDPFVDNDGFGLLAFEPSSLAQSGSSAAHAAPMPATPVLPHRDEDQASIFGEIPDLFEDFPVELESVRFDDQESWSSDAAQSEPSSPQSSCDNPSSGEEFSFSDEQLAFLQEAPECEPVRTRAAPKRKSCDSESTDPQPAPKRRKREASRDVTLPVYEMHVKQRFYNVQMRLFSPSVAIPLDAAITARPFRVRIDENDSVSIGEELFPCAQADPQASKEKLKHDCVARRLVLNRAATTFSGTAVCKCFCKNKLQRGNDLLVLVLCANDVSFATSAVCRITCNRGKNLRALSNDEKRSCSSDSEGSSPSAPSVANPSTPLFPQPTAFAGRL
jgi:hypothetical protein